MSELSLVYLGLGGNIGDSCQIIFSCVEQITSLPRVFQVSLSSLYRTSPVSDIPQRDYVNAVCSLQTSLSPFELHSTLQNIEIALGKGPKGKNEPRIIDIDLLFFGSTYIDSPTLKIPHPRWKERLFVLIPLVDLTKTIAVPSNSSHSKIDLIDLTSLIDQFPNPHSSYVKPFLEVALISER